MKRVAIILAGGRSERMGGRDKALAEIDGRRLIDHVVARLLEQADIIAISGNADYGTKLPVIPDDREGPQGPAAGVFAASRWVSRHCAPVTGFCTAPVDGPFFPGDLIARLVGAGGSAVAVDDEGVHPTFAYWTIESLTGAWPAFVGRSSVSLRSIAATAKARQVRWPGGGRFFNVNTPAALAAARARYRAEGTPPSS